MFPDSSRTSWRLLASHALSFPSSVYAYPLNSPDLAWWSRPRNVLAHALVRASALSLTTTGLLEHVLLLAVGLQALVRL